ncbi:hypothetical protein DFH11DRAFT_1729824 [Phellopilus nigrolimitatus]|nr:hypothetical protein DFH11DRAFT_1729824 [Phellopilus nigrolimitatus]
MATPFPPFLCTSFFAAVAAPATPPSCARVLRALSSMHPYPSPPFFIFPLFFASIFRLRSPSFPPLSEPLYGAASLQELTARGVSNGIGIGSAARLFASVRTWQPASKYMYGKAGNGGSDRRASTARIIPPGAKLAVSHEKIRRKKRVRTTRPRVRERPRISARLCFLADARARRACAVREQCSRDFE